MDVWKVGIDCRQKGGIKKLVKDNFGVREEYFLEYDMEMIRKMELKKKLKEEKEQRKLSKNKKIRGGNDLFMIREDEDLWTDKPATMRNVQEQIEENLKTLKNQGRKTGPKFANKAQKLGISKKNKIKSTSVEFIMTSFMSIGLGAEKGLKQELKQKKKKAKAQKAIFKKDKGCNSLIEKLEIFRGLEDLQNVPSNIFQWRSYSKCCTGSRFRSRSFLF